MEKKFTSTAHVFERDDINTDEIIPARRMISHDEVELAKYALEDLDTDFINRVKKGDIIIAGNNFGCGSSREHAIWALRGSGIKGVIAKSFARIFFRNAVNNGFFALQSAEAVERIKNGEKITVDIENSMIISESGEEIPFEKQPDFVLEIAKKGGLLETIPNLQQGA